MPPDDRDPPTAADPLFGPTEPVAAPAAGPGAVFCRRCGETSLPVEHCCPWCRAWLVGEPPRVAPVYRALREPEADWHADLREEDLAPPPRKPSRAWPMAVVGVSYFLLLGSLVAFIVVAVAYGISDEQEMFAGLAVVEVLDAILAVVALGLVWTSAKQVAPAGTRGLAWLAALPMLAALLCVNILFITYLRELVKPFGPVEAQKMQVTWVTVLLICVQPAIVEELFFRQMVLGVFRKSVGLHAAVWITAAMFAFAHLGNPVGMPYLCLAGAVFGYARVFGGLPLPMVMHFIHNLVVISYEAWR